MRQIKVRRTRLWLNAIMRVSRISLILALVATLAGCAHHQPVWSQETVIRIPGKASQGLPPGSVLSRMLILAARTTVDHGYRYFELMSPVRPGVDVPIRVFGSGESPHASNVYDADAIAAGQLPTAAQ